MQIDYIEDILRRYFNNMPVDKAEIACFLEERFPNLKRLNDPREVKAEDILYESNGEIIKFQTKDNEVILNSKTEESKCDISINEYSILSYELKDEALSIEEYYFDQKDRSFYSYSYYDSEATNLLLKGRNPLEFNISGEIKELSLEPDNSFYVNISKKERKGFKLFRPKDMQFDYYLTATHYENDEEIIEEFPYNFTLPFCQNVMPLNLKERYINKEKTM